jgi:hypothetical protein
MSALLALLFFVPFLLIVGGIAHVLWSRRTVAIYERRQLQGQQDPVGSVLGYALPRLAQSSWRPAPATAGSTTILERRYFPAWTIVISVLFFPVGLLALLARGRQVITFTARDGELLAVGDGTAWARDVVADAADAVVDASHA